MNRKRKGNKNERKTIRLLEASGYACMKSGASLGVFDVIGIGLTDIVLVQVKSNSWPRVDEMESLKLFTCPPNCKKLVHRWKDYARNPDVKIL